MTSRIQEDGSGTEAKWADIDDDEDDWAPETIEWNDGTKITLTHTESSVSAPTQDEKRSKDVKDTPPADQPTTRDTAKVLFSKSSTTVGPNATVLRLGANADKQQQAKAASTSKAGNEKPTLTAKSPAAPPPKSPWAPLPPVDKVSPVNPPVQAQPSMRFPQREQRQGPDTTPGPLPAREIAADDFNRSWRDNHTNAPRELYNSQSGRYEPVHDTRKASRNEPQMRTPSLLQRPTHNEQTGPAEPSPAFQTHRTSNQEGSHWTRRRTSSNVSGGSGSYGRRMSLGRPDGLSKLHDLRRGSQANGVFEQSTSPNETSLSKEAAARGPSPNRVSPGPGWQPRSSANMTYAPPGSHSGVPQTGAPSASNEQNRAQILEEDPIAMQQRIMREKRIEARQRRMEQEQREEAERRERIRLKLEALGPLPSKDKEKEKEKEKEEKEKKTKENEEKGKEKEMKKEGEKPKAQDEPAATKPATKEPAAPASTSSAPTQSPPKPPVPEPTGEPKQYGMMKVHHPESVKKLVAASERVSERTSAAAAPSQHGASPTGNDASKPNGIQQYEESSHSQNQDQHREPALDDKGAPWRGNLNNQSSYSPWGPGSKLGSHTSPSANPWKPLSSDKTLGNGTFDRNLTTFAPRELPLRGHVGLSEPQPIGPISNNSDKIGGPQPFSGSRISQENQPSLTSLPSPEQKHAPYEPFNPIARPRPIGPPGSHPNHWQAETRRNAESATSAWHNFHAVAAKKDAEDNERFHRELNAIRDEGAASLQVSFNETWRQVRPGDQAGQRQVIGVSRANDAAGTLAPLHSFDAVDGLPFAENHSRPFNVTGRGSRFFPATDVKRVVSADEGRARSPSPPPPEEVSSHPVFTGDSQRPLVHLPTPKPVVKLPPKTNPPPPKPATFASMVAATPRPANNNNPSAGATSWQDRINDLFGKKAPTEKKNTLAVTSSTKEPLDVQSQPSPAAVSFPQITESELEEDAGKVTSKEVEEEEEIFEDREAGSLPVVRVPDMAPPMAWRAALPPPPRLRPKVLKPMQVHSVEPFVIGLLDKDASGNLQVVIHFPGSENTKTVALPKKAGGNHGSRQKGASNYRSRKNAKPRDASGGFNGSQGSKRQNSSAHGKGNASSSRGGFGQGSWGPRVPAGVAH